jgi:hypothetical protein
MQGEGNDLLKILPHKMKRKCYRRCGCIQDVFHTREIIHHETKSARTTVPRFLEIHFPERIPPTERKSRPTKRCVVL